MKKHLPAIIAVLVIIAGLSLLLYPTVSNYVHSLQHRRVIANYEKKVSELNPEDYKELLDSAVEYNRKLAENSTHLLYLTDEERQEYERQLDLTGTGVMGYIRIPSVDIFLPIYHGTEDTVLQRGVGHLEGSSLPVGGESVHTILSGHRGLPSSKLFTDIDKLEEGDIFTIKVLNETLTYEVDQILTILPTELSSLRIEEGHDYCTLMTCTPYGVNTHRLLIRGHRIPTPVGSDAESPARTVGEKVGPLVILGAAAAIILPVFLIVLAIRYKKKRKE